MVGNPRVFPLKKGEGEGLKKTDFPIKNRGIVEEAGGK